MDKNSKIVVTGGAGFLGSWVVKELRKRGFTDIFIPRSKDYDLRSSEVCKRLLTNADAVIHLAATMGGIHNLKNPGSVFYDNAIMGINMIEASRQAGVKKFVYSGTVCSYPKFTPVPFKEENLWFGYPDESHAPYGLAKKMLMAQLMAYRAQYNFRGISLLLGNLYGPGDNFGSNNSHVIPALIKKIYDAKENGERKIIVWGDGSPSRDFLYVEDAARGVVDVMEKYDDQEPVNLGSGKEITINELVNLLCNILNFKGEIQWDHSKPNGQPRRRLDVSRAFEQFQFQSTIPLVEGLQRTVAWYEQQRFKK